MGFMRSAALAVLLAFVVSMAAGCGVSRNKYEALVNEKIALEEKLILLTRSRDALRAEFEDLLKEKMDFAAKLETAMNEKNAMKGEYDKLLDEKVALKAAYDKLASSSAQAAVKPASKK